MPYFLAYLNGSLMLSKHVSFPPFIHNFDNFLFSGSLFRAKVGFMTNTNAQKLGRVGFAVDKKARSKYWVEDFSLPPLFPTHTLPFSVSGRDWN